MEKEISRVHRLSLPLIIKKKGSVLTISDGYFAKDCEFKDFGQLKVTGIDREGSVTFELSMPQQTTLVESPLPLQRVYLEDSPAVMSDFILIGSGTAKSSSGNVSRGTYEYFKRPSDDYYLAVHKLEGKKDRKIHVGKIQDPTSVIHKIVYPIIESIEPSKWFDRKELLQHVKGASARHGQRLKSSLDILVLEGFLERKEAKQSGRVYEQYMKTPKILSIKFQVMNVHHD